MNLTSERPAVTELRLSAFKSHQGASFALGPLTLLAGASGTGKSSVLEALAALGRLAGGETLGEVFDGSGDREGSVRGGAAACVPQGAQPDAEGRRGFRVGCTVTGPVGPVRLDVAVQTEPELRIVGERLTGGGQTLLTTALRDPERRTVQAAWHTAGLVPVTRAPLPDDLLATALLPLRVAGRTEGQRLVLAAVEQMVLALRGVFPVEPRPETMRAPVDTADGMLRRGCENLSAVLARTEGECRTRHAALVRAMREVCSPPVEGLTVLRTRPAGADRGAEALSVIAAVDRGPLGLVPVDRLGDGELRFLGIALVLLTGPGVLEVDTSAELLPAAQVLTVLSDGFDLGMDRRQSRELLSLAGMAAERGHIRLLGVVHDASVAEGLSGVSVIDFARPKRSGDAGEVVVEVEGAGLPESAEAEPRVNLQRSASSPGVQSGEGAGGRVPARRAPTMR
ncbi:ATP-binding protein [Streptomyces sp. SPB162]|uniref:AAA family ATPase n=1 Tax=Streptomyces sp. SPB162 TaxID=2940560 RepID=UPI002405BF3C|nr:ATP-binding protein [Streptomyces sp. SPB162]MDF9816165.1 energy-coupling factor transporter ATP-binding protein EcfA2 [Streptomyces sp. SPB162]